MVEVRSDDAGVRVPFGAAGWSMRLIRRGDGSPLGQALLGMTPEQAAGLLGLVGVHERPYSLLAAHVIERSGPRNEGGFEEYLRGFSRGIARQQSIDGFEMAMHGDVEGSVYDVVRSGVIRFTVEASLGDIGMNAVGHVIDAEAGYLMLLFVAPPDEIPLGELRRGADRVFAATETWAPPPDRDLVSSPIGAAFAGIASMFLALHARKNEIRRRGGG